MPHHFRKTPSSRRAPSLTAKWVVPGPTIAAEIKYGRRTTHIIPCKQSHHRRRFHDGQRLSVRAYVGGPTECHVTITSARRVQLRDVDYPVARELGYVRVDDFRVAWIEDHEQAWLEGNDAELLIDAMLERFDRRHAHKEVWLLRFDLDRTRAPRLLAQNGRAGGNYRTLADGRWQYLESAEDAETDRGYTSVPALALPGEIDALTDDEWKLHVDGNRDLTHDQWVALGRLELIDQRARAHADRGRNMRRRAA